MRLFSGTYQNQPIRGVVDDGGAIDLSGRYHNAPDLVAASLDPGQLQAAIDVAGDPIPLSQITLSPPVPNPSKIICVGKNYADHAAEMGSGPDGGAHPTLFTRFADSLVGPDQPLVKPTASDTFDYEGELAVVIGRPIRNVSPTEAMTAVGGYSVFMDGTIRAFQQHTSQFTAGKNFERSGSWGPWITSADEVGDPSRLRIRTTINDEVHQDATTDQLIHPIGEILAYISSFTTLHRGDVIATGTPSGVGAARTPPRWLQAGDTVEVNIERVGNLRNRVVDPGGQ